MSLFSEAAAHAEAANVPASGRKHSRLEVASGGARAKSSFGSGAADANDNGIAAQSPSDEELLSRIANGGRSAMEALYTRHHVRMFRFALRITQSESVAEDVISEVFLDVWRQADRFEGRSAVSTWLLGIARFKALSTLQRHLNESCSHPTGEETHLALDDPMLALERAQRSASIFKCLSKLSVKHREVVDLVYYHDKSFAETAEILGISQNTVKARMLQARQRLAHSLKLVGIDRV